MVCARDIIHRHIMSPVFFSFSFFFCKPHSPPPAFFCRAARTFSATFTRCVSARYSCWGIEDMRWHLVQPQYVRYSTFRMKPKTGGGEVYKHDLAVYGARDVDKVKNKRKREASPNGGIKNDESKRKKRKETRCIPRKKLTRRLCSSNYRVWKKNKPKRRPSVFISRL